MNLPPEVQAEINQAVEILRQDPNIQKIILFGSYATEEYQPDSDIDLAVVLNTLPSINQRRKYKRTLDIAASADSAHEIDLLFCTAQQLNTDEMVYKFINQEGVTLYEQL